MAKILSVKKITKGTITLDESILDYLFLNEGDYIAFVEENNKIYLRKTRKSQTQSEAEDNESPPPPTFEEKTAEFSGIPNMNSSNIFDAVQEAMKNPEMMKMFQDTAKQLFSAFGDLGKNLDPNKIKKKGEQEEDDDEFEDDFYDVDDSENDKDDDDNDEGFKVDIE